MFRQQLHNMRTNTYNRIVTSLLLFSVCFLALLPQVTQAFFSDTEESAGQRFAAAELLFDTTFDNQEFYVGPGLAVAHEFILPVSFSASSVKNKYDIRVVSTSGHDTFCGALALEAVLGSESSSGYFTDFSSAEFDSAGLVSVSVFYNESVRAIPHNATCTAEVVVEAWQENMQKATAGYRDSEQFSITVTAHMVVLNEVLARPNTVDMNTPNVEFIELYNNSDFPIDVLGFNITELTAAGIPTNHFIANMSTAPSSALVAYDGSFSTIVPAHGHLALKYRGSASYLNDNGDTITLIDTTTGAAIDSYRYTSALIGKSDARIPDGTGTWIDPVPTPDAPNTLDELLVETPATTSLFIDLLEIEHSSSTVVDTEVASGTEEALVIEVPVAAEEVTPSAPSLVEGEAESEEEPLLKPEIEEGIALFVEEKVDEISSIPLPLTDSNSAPEEALLNPEPAVRTTEDEETSDESEITPTET